MPSESLKIKTISPNGYGESIIYSQPIISEEEPTFQSVGFEIPNGLLWYKPNEGLDYVDSQLFLRIDNVFKQIKLEDYKLTGGTIIGYLYDNNFYYDVEHTNLVEPNSVFIYIDITERPYHTYGYTDNKGYFRTGYVINHGNTLPQEANENDIFLLDIEDTQALSNIGAVSYKYRQDLSNVEKEIARNNIGVSSGGSDIPFDDIGNGLKIENRILKVDVVDNMLQDNTKPITSGAVYTQIGNIESLLSSI